MSKVLFLSYNRNDSCSFYRSAGVVADLRRKTPHNITVMQWTGAMDWSIITSYDLIIFQRPYNKTSLSLLSYIKACGIPIWVDYDDNLLDIPIYNEAFDIYGDEEKDAIKKILALADVVTVTTDELKHSFAEWSDKIQVIPNAFNDLIFQRPDKLPKRDNRVLWRGTNTHIGDIMAFERAINKVAADFKDTQFLYMGYRPWFLEPINNARVKSQDIIVYFQSLLKLAPKIMQVPLHDNNFNRCKSDIAAIEGTFAGAVSVVPSWWNIPSCLSYTDEQSYYDALYAVLSGSVDVEAMNRISWEYIQDNLRLSTVNVLRLQILNQFL